MTDERGASIKLCGLWEKEDKDGDLTLAGPFTYGNRIFICKNPNKESNKHPDYLMFLQEVKPRKPEDEDRRERPEPRRQERRQSYEAPPPEDDIPF